jgi:hypothetical protein
MRIDLEPHHSANSESAVNSDQRKVSVNAGSDHSQDDDFEARMREKLLEVQTDYTLYHETESMD